MDGTFFGLFGVPWIPRDPANQGKELPKVDPICIRLNVGIIYILGALASSSYKDQQLETCLLAPTPLKEPYKIPLKDPHIS